jgi:hypothetical protein
MNKTVYSDECTVRNLDLGQDVDAEVLQFRPEEFLTVSIQRQIKLRLTYDAKKKLYLGAMAGYEFTSRGPDQYTAYHRSTR